MSSELNPDAVEFGRVVSTALDAHGGFTLVQAADADPDLRQQIDEILDGLGVWELDVLGSPAEAEAAAAVCMAAGRFALPYPVAERLAAGPGQAAVALVGDHRPIINHADLGLRWFAANSAGQQAAVLTVGSPVGGKIGRFACPVALGRWTAGDHNPAVLLALQGWSLLGTVIEASQMTYRYAGERQQFGQALARFQGLQFWLTDVEVAVQGLAELASYTLWSAMTGRDEALTDAVALRVAALECAEETFRACHQIHGAIGFCDETPLSWLSRLSQPMRRLPWGRTQSEAVLLDQLRNTVFAGPFQAETPIL